MTAGTVTAVGTFVLFAAVTLPALSDRLYHLRPEDDTRPPKFILAPDCREPVRTRQSKT